MALKSGKQRYQVFNGIQTKNNDLDEKIQKAAKLVEKDFQQAVSAVQTSTKKLKEEKQNYEDLVTISSDGDVQNANQIEKYELETLYVRLGNHATSQGVDIQLDVLTGTNNAKDYYNLKFTATGSYISITDFISAIENDSMLGFKIEEFKMSPSGTTETLQASFVCKNIAIKEFSTNKQINNTNFTDDETEQNINTNQNNKEPNNTNTTNKENRNRNTNTNETNTNKTNTTGNTSTNSSR